MDKIVRQGQYVFAAAIVALGVEHFVFAHFGGKAPRIIPWVPGGPVMTYVTGAFLIATGLCIAFNYRARVASILFAALFLVCVVLLQAPQLVAYPMRGDVRTTFFEILSFGAFALTLAGTLPAAAGMPPRWHRVLQPLIDCGPYLFAVSCVVFGIDHFRALEFIASLVPSWIPGAYYWVAFFGAGFIAVGVSIALRLLDDWGAMLLGGMFLLWFVTLHVPRVLSDAHMHDPDEWSSAFIALGMGGGSWIIAWNAIERRRQVAR